MLRSMMRVRCGVSLVEVMVAFVLIAITFVAFQMGAVLALRTVIDATRESLASALVRARVERLLAAPCQVADGVDSVDGVRVQWRVTATSGLATIDQTMRYRSVRGIRTESYLAVGNCL